MTKGKVSSIESAPILRCSPATHQMVKRYSDKTMIPMRAVVDDIIADWMESVAPARLQALGKTKVSQNEKK